MEHDMTPNELRKLAPLASIETYYSGEFPGDGSGKVWVSISSELRTAADAWEKLEKSWLALLRQVSKLDPETQDWDGADDGTFLEEFDPWVILRRLVGG